MSPRLPAGCARISIRASSSWSAGLEPDEQEDVFHFCRDFGAPVVAEATSGLREALQGLAIHHADRVLKSRPPGKILRLGEVPSGRFWRDLEEMPEVSVWSICRNGLPGLARESQVTRGPLDRVIPALGDVEATDDALDLLVGASGRAARIEELLECYPDSEPALITRCSRSTHRSVPACFWATACRSASGISVRPVDASPFRR
jgi:2-succinyl-5-enolpyruvyl-6-hydroxy-3-cyclohexene-1-carboxylate synthase